MKMIRSGDEDEVKMTMRWKLLNQDAKRGNANAEEKRKHQHMKTWPTTGKPWKGKEKEKRRQTETEPDQRRGGRTEAPEPTYHGETYTNLGTRRVKPTWREENAGTHEIGGPMGN